MGLRDRLKMSKDDEIKFWKWLFWIDTVILAIMFVVAIYLGLMLSEMLKTCS